MLTIATVVSKVLGAIFKIPLANILGGVGMSYFTSAYDLFTPIYSLTVTGLGVASSRLVAEYTAKRDINRVETVLYVCKRLFICMGIMGMVVMFLLAPLFVNIIKNPSAYFSVIAIIPAVLFSCISAIYRGYYQGLSNMTPTAVSQMIESFFRMICGILCSYAVDFYLSKQYLTTGHIFGNTFHTQEAARLYILRYSAAGAIVGVTISTAIGALYIYLKFRASHNKKINVKYQEKRYIAKKLAIVAVPIAFSTVVVNLSTFIDLVTVMNCLKIAVEKNSDILLEMYSGNIPAGVKVEMLPEYLYGSYSGLVGSLYNLIPAITVAIGISALPSISRRWASGDSQGLQETMLSVMRITMLIAIPAGLGIAVLAKPILLLLYPARAMEVNIVSHIMQVMGISAILVSASTSINSILQAVGKERIPMIILSIGAVVKLVTNYMLISRPDINIQGVAYGTLLCHIVILIMGSCAVTVATKIKQSIYRIYLKPLFCASVASAFAHIIYQVFPGENGVKTVVAVVFTMLIYLTFIVFTGSICKIDIEMLPLGEKTAKRLEKLKFLR